MVLKGASGALTLWLSGHTRPWGLMGNAKGAFLGKSTQIAGGTCSCGADFRPRVNSFLCLAFYFWKKKIVWLLQNFCSLLHKSESTQYMFSKAISVATWASIKAQLCKSVLLSFNSFFHFRSPSRFHLPYPTYYFFLLFPPFVAVLPFLCSTSWTVRVCYKATLAPHILETKFSAPIPFLVLDSQQSILLGYNCEDKLRCSDSDFCCICLVDLLLYFVWWILQF